MIYGALSNLPLIKCGFWVRTNEHATNITLCEFFLGGIFSHINHFAHLLVQFVIEIVVTSRLRDVYKRQPNPCATRAKVSISRLRDSAQASEVKINTTRPIL